MKSSTKKKTDQRRSCEATDNKKAQQRRCCVDLWQEILLHQPFLQPPVQETGGEQSFELQKLSAPKHLTALLKVAADSSRLTQTTIVSILEKGFFLFVI